jgi:hypothetical protein
MRNIFFSFHSDACSIPSKKIYVTPTGTLSTLVDVFDFLNHFINDAQSFPVSSVNAYRYLKLTALESQTGITAHTFMAEIDVFATK